MLKELIPPQFIEKVEKEIEAKKALDLSFYEILEVSKQEFRRACTIVSVSREKLEESSSDKASSWMGHGIQNTFTNVEEYSKEKIPTKETLQEKVKEQGKVGQRMITQWPFMSLAWGFKNFKKVSNTLQKLNDPLDYDVLKDLANLLARVSTWPLRLCPKIQ